MPQPPEPSPKEPGLRRPVIASRTGVVAASHPLAAAAGAEILAGGGNAFDAAVATAAVLTVVEPFLSSPFGFGAATLWAAGDGRMRALDFSAVLPEAWTPTPEASLRGPRAVAVGPALAGWQDLISAHGSRRFAEVLAPAIALAREGVPLVPSVARRLAAAAATLRGQPATAGSFADWAAIYAPGGHPLPAGAVLRQPDLADTLQAAAEGGAHALYAGALGEKIAAHLARLAGPEAAMTPDDIARISPGWGRPLHASYRDLEFHLPAPPCQAVRLLLGLKLLEAIDFAALPHLEGAPLDAIWRALRLAAMECTARDEEGLEAMLEEGNLARLAARLADPKPVEGPVGQARGTAPEGDGTALAVADRAGNLVSLTQSLGSPFGAGIVVPGTGICLNNALAWAGTASPGAPLPLPLAPAIATRAGAPVLALAPSGGFGACQILAQMLVRYVDDRLPLQQAVEAPRARLYDGRCVLAEGRLAVEALAARGHVLETAPDWAELAGEVQAVAREPATGVITGAADPRREGMAVAA